MMTFRKLPEDRVAVRRNGDDGWTVGTAHDAAVNIPDFYDRQEALRALPARARLVPAGELEPGDTAVIGRARVRVKAAQVNRAGTLVTVYDGRTSRHKAAHELVRIRLGGGN